MRLTFLLFMLGCFGTAHAGWFGPSNYDECILENMKGVALVQAVLAIKNSCRAKFPEACYAWQKAKDAKSRDKKPGIFDELDKEHGVNQPDPYLASSYRQAPEDVAPDGCYAVLR